MGRLVITALAFLFGLGSFDAPWAEPAQPRSTLETGAIAADAPDRHEHSQAHPDVSEVTTVPAGYLSDKAFFGAEATSGTLDEELPSEPSHKDAGPKPNTAEGPPDREARESAATTKPDVDPEEGVSAPTLEKTKTEAKPDETEDASRTTAADEAAPAGGITPPAGAETVAGRAPDAKMAVEPEAEAIRARLAELPEEGEPHEVAERAALTAFYAEREYAPLWMEATGFNTDAKAVIEALNTAAEWGLDAEDFAPPELAETKSGDLPVADRAVAELDLMQMVLKYARHARGGRIMAPSEQLNSNLDRRAQLIEPQDVLAGVASAPDKAAALLDTHPKHRQFHLLREKYVAALGKDRNAAPNAAAKRIRANMEMWRWKWPDVGSLHLMANVPAYTLRVVKDEETIHSERIVVGELGKQTSIFSRRLQDITFRPMWRVPEGIKVRELWPSLLRGGGLMRQYGLELETKSGRRLDWRTVDWANTDIRDYEVVQPPGPKSAMGMVKFSFPSQHTIFMHDTPDKWMFGQRQRTLSAGCLRLRNPLRVAEIVLAHDKGWDAEKVGQLARSGPLNNDVPIEGRIPMHIVYQTTWVNEDGKLETYPDIYGHERRVTLALDGRWDQINKGRNHLAPYVPDRREISRAKSAPQARGTSRSGSANSTFMSSFGGGF